MVRALDHWCPQLKKPGAIATALGLLTSTACMFQPAHEQAVCGANASVRFSGYVPSASTTLTLEAAGDPSGPFVSMGTTQSRSSGFTLSGETYYYFSADLPVTEWRSDAGGLSSFVRGKLGSYNLLTFEAQNGAGQTGIECVAAGIGAGQAPSTAALACDRDDPVLEITAPPISSCACAPFSVPGDLVIDDAVGAADAQCVTSISGALRVLASAPDLVSLASLTSIGGEAELHYELDPGVGGLRNRSIDLSALTSIGGDVAITTHRGLSQSKSLDTQTGAVTSIGGDVTISTYDNNVTAFGAVTSLSGSLTLEGETGPSGNLDIFGGSTFPSLTSVGGDLTVQGFYACNDVFGSVVSVGGDVVARAVRLAPLQSFDSLETVGGDLRFHEMKEFGPPWPSLISVGGELHALDNAPLTQLSDLPVGAIDADGLRLEDNASLVTMDGSVQVGTGDITISGSPTLSQCDVDAFLVDQAAGGWTGSSAVSGTLICP